MVLTRAATQDDLPEMGSIDVRVYNESPCGKKSSIVNFIICDVDEEVSRPITASREYASAGEKIDFTWKASDA